MTNNDGADQEPTLTGRQKGELEAIRRGWLKEETIKTEPGSKSHALAWMKRRGWLA
ncbi:hypothetical protein [Nocardia lijiangensis]|uniref:hypothetical protein n=1 Tax=Nocardia lijiangensis TaxID=299618 RepID=UPI000A929598|nr:hypothetical protein [Nocardia lijiangensis]